MREILFRGKGFNGEWEYGVPVFSGLNNELAFMKQMHSYDHQVIPETVGQYTGLTDKNGTKIFEGDILKQYGFCYVVSYNDGTFIAYETPYNEGAVIPRYDWQFAKVIGNIHDNPELLKGGVE